MHIYYWSSKDGNVGDDLNNWLWPEVFGDDYFDPNSSDRFVGIGSVLDDRHAQSASAQARTVVFGAGARGYRHRPRQTDKLDIMFVRGPRTAALLSNPSTRYISDPAILTPLYAQDFAPPPSKNNPVRIGYIPYYETPKDISLAICAATGMTPIPITQPVDTFLDTLVKCDYVISEAMHGAILADAFRIPWMGCRVLSGLYEGTTSFFKWADWMESLKIKAPPFSNSVPDPVLFLPRKARLAFSTRARAKAVDQVTKVLASQNWTLSADTRLGDAQTAMLEEARKLKDSDH